MLNLNGIVSVDILREIDEYVGLRLRDRRKYQCAEALALYEQKILPDEEIFAICEKEAGMDLYVPAVSYIPDNIIKHFEHSEVIPVSFSPMRGLITCICLPELSDSFMPMDNYKIVVKPTTIYNYFHEYLRLYGRHPDLLDVPAKQLLDSIVNEGISIKAADVTLSSNGMSANIYYNVRKRKVYSNRLLTATNIADIISLLCFESPMDMGSRKPKYVGVSLNDFYRGRVVINTKYDGYAITIRFLPNAAFNQTLESCNITKESAYFLRHIFMNKELGLRIIAGSTMSGKNTTALACLHEIAEADRYKIVSIEMPVEQVLEGVEQINCDTEDEYDANINSLLRQNPDFVYLTEMGDTNASSIMRVTNTGKRVLTTLHANSCADIIGRLQDITGLSTDRIIQTIHSMVYQELVRDDETDTVKPKNKYIYLSNERKAQLYGKEYGEVLLKLESWEGGDVW